MMRKATLHISNNQAIITMPSTPTHKNQLNKRKDSASDQHQLNQSIKTTKNIGLIESKSIAPRSPSPLFDKSSYYENELLNTSNFNQTTSFRYPSNISQAALSSSLTTTMSNTHFNQSSPLQQINSSFSSTTNQQQTQLKTQQDLEEQYFSTIDNNTILHNAYQNQKQKNSKPKLLRQKHAELMELPPRTRDRLPSATPSSFSNYSGTCGFTTNYTAGLTPPFNPNINSAYFEQTAISSGQTMSNEQRLSSSGASNYYSYWEDANSFVAQAANANAAAEAATANSNNPTLRNATYLSNSQSSQNQQFKQQQQQSNQQQQQQQQPINSQSNDFNRDIREQQQNSMNTGRLASDLSQNDIDSSFEYLSKLNLRCRSVPLLEIFIKSEPDPPEEEEEQEFSLIDQHIVENKESTQEKELITFIDFLNENSTSNEKIDQIKEQQNQYQQNQTQQPINSSINQQRQQELMNTSNTKLEKIDSDEENGYADVESVSEIMNFSNRQQTVIRRDHQTDHLIDIEIKDNQDESAQLIDSNLEKDEFIIDQLDNSSKFDEMKENRSPISDDGLELEIEDDDEDIGNFGDTDEIKLLPTTPSTYSLFQKLMNKHNSSSKEGGNNSNQNTLRKHSSDIESQNRSNSLVNYSYHKHRHRRKKDDESLVDDQVKLDNLDNNQQQQQQHHHHHHGEKNTSSATMNKPFYKKYSEGNEKRKQSSKKIKDKQHHRIYDMPNIDSLQHQQTKLLKNEHILTSNSLPSSRSMQLCQENSFDQSNEQINDLNNSNTINEQQQKQLNMRSQSKESVKSPKNEKKKRKFSKKALHLLKVNHFRKSKSEETGKELESLANKTLSAVCKARSYNYNLIKNMNEYNLSQQSSVFNSANNSYEENYNLTNSNLNSQQHSNFYLDQQQQIYQSQQTHLNQYQHNQYPIQYAKTGSLGQHHLQTNVQPTSQLYQQPQQQSANTFERPILNADQLMTDDTRLFAVHIQNTDRKLKSSKGIVNPFVRMHVVDLNTGESLQTSEFSYQSAIGANAGTYVGSLKGKEYIQPITTQPCDLLFKLKYPTFPIWEETMILNEPYDFLKQNDVILFFEILDYVRLDHSELLSSFQLQHWSYRVAWGYFLLNNVRNQLDNQSNQMIKLQLYKPFMHTVEKTFEPYCQIYNWWKNYKRIPYPASLFLTLTTVSIGELSNPKHPIHLRILNKSLNRQLLNQRRLPDYWKNLDNDYYQQQKNYDQNINYPAIRNLRQYQQSLLNSSIEDQDQDQPIHSRIPFNQTMAMPSNQLHHNSQSFHQSSLPSNTAQQSITQQTNLSQRNWNKSSSTNSQQHCKLPSSTWHQLSAGNNKCCYNVAFSNDGTKIACCASVFTAYISTEKRSSIFIYDIPGGNFLQRVNGFHSAPIFYLDWSKGDKLLASASADATCQVWQMRRQHCAPLVLNHPCMVYTVKFHPINATLLATGAYDGAVRIWCIQESLKSTIKEPVLLQCVTATGNIPGATFHAQVLALCWMSYFIDYIGPNGQTEQKTELLLFSGCTRGNLMALKQDELNLSWQPNKKMKIKEIMNIAINEIKCCPNENRLILFCRDGVQRMVDVFSETIIMRYIGSLNFNHLIRGCLSFDGRTLYAGSEDAIVHVWNVDTGTIASINYHPHEDIIAISGLNARTISVCLYKHYSNRELPSPSKQKLTSSDPNYSQQQQQQQIQPTSTTKKASMVTSNEQGHTIVSFAHEEYKQDELMTATNKSVGSLGQATTVAERTRLQAKIKPELKKSHTIDHSSNTASTPARTANQKVQKAMRKLAIRLSFNEKS